MPTFRQAPRLRLALSSVAAASRAEGVPLEVVVVDDADEPLTEKIVAAVAKDLTVRLVAGGHGGRAVARNRGARAAAGERLLFLDGDVLLGRGTLSLHREREADGAVIRGGILRMPWLSPFSDPEAGTLTERARMALGDVAAPGLASRRVQFGADGYLSEDLARRARENQFERDIVAWFAAGHASGRWLGVTGAHVSVARDVFFRLQGFDEEMGRRWGAEDLEFGFRAELAGTPITHLAGATVYHMDHDTSGREGDHAAALEYFARKHQTRRVLRLLDYFQGNCPFAQVARA